MAEETKKPTEKSLDSKPAKKENLPADVETSNANESDSKASGVVKEQKKDVKDDKAKTSTQNGKYPQMASFLDRFFAWLIDISVFGGITFLFYIVGFFVLVFLPVIFQNDTFFSGLILLGFLFVLMILYPIVFYFYFVRMYMKHGATIGKKALNLKVVRTEDLSYMGFWRVLLREIIGRWLSSLVFYLGYFWYFLSEKRQTWHDVIADTYVVKTDKKGELLKTNQSKYEKKTLYALLPVGCFLLLWIGYFTLIFGTLIFGIIFADKHTGNYYNDDMYNYQDNYDDMFDDNDSYYDDDYLPNRNPQRIPKGNGQDEMYDKQGTYGDDDLDEYLEELFKDFDE